MTTKLDTRELITMDYKQEPTDRLERLKLSIMHEINTTDERNAVLHREYNSIRIELATRALNEMEGQQQQTEAQG